MDILAFSSSLERIKENPHEKKESVNSFNGNNFHFRRLNGYLLCRQQGCRSNDKTEGLLIEFMPEWRCYHFSSDDRRVTGQHRGVN
ncbi:hypothetical protein AVEN_71636-1 [Araneus ventricosus]|uniref:Uncharacterized protein n=1 Tax=Araneus ventricosus TaxID=182803 RepID=A0A4Y2KK59_ARAVE|nr:hypothetical protein AVEN_71636-1 [Araneus ventricosus]